MFPKDSHLKSCWHWEMGFCLLNWLGAELLGWEEVFHDYQVGKSTTKQFPQRAEWGEMIGSVGERTWSINGFKNHQGFRECLSAPCPGRAPVCHCSFPPLELLALQVKEPVSSRMSSSFYKHFPVRIKQKQVTGKGTGSSSSGLAFECGCDDWATHSCLLKRAPSRQWHSLRDSTPGPRITFSLSWIGLWKKIFLGLSNPPGTLRPRWWCLGCIWLCGSFSVYRALSMSELSVFFLRGCSFYCTCPGRNWDRLVIS